MRDEQKVWQLTGETSGSIFPLARTVMGETFAKHITEQRFYNFIFTAAQVAPKSITADLLHKRNPYNDPATIKPLLSDIAAAGYIDPDGKGGYTASDKGIEAIQAVHQVFYDHVNQANRMPVNKLKELAGLLDKLVTACTKADFPNGTLCLDISHNGHPTVEPASLARIDQLLDDLNAFRDDAHLAAWTHLDVDGHTWEVLTFVWNGEINTAEKLTKQLTYRTYTTEDYTKTLNALTERGWIEPGDDGYKVTKLGKQLRDEVEEKTNTNYFGPWKALSDDELNRLAGLLQELKDTNLKIVEETQTG